MVSVLLLDGKGHIVASLGEASGYVPYTVYMAQDAFLQAHPDVVEAFTRAIYKGQQWVESHSAAEIAKVIQPQFAETDLDTLTTIVERYQKQLGIQGPVITYNGAMILDSADGRVLYRQELKADDARLILEAGLNYDTTMCIWSDNKLYGNKLNDRIQ